nr:protein PNS1-like isoform X2 [Arachis hypogaea]XP_025687066.1 protein PNS1-like isoform X2 [Arachis hypogaea]
MPPELLLFLLIIFINLNNHHLLSLLLLHQSPKCCFRVMESIFRYGNGWAYVQIAAYGKSLLAAPQNTWSLFKRLEMEAIVDSDITSSICLLSGVSIASISVIAVSAWTSQFYQNFTATLSLLTFFIGYLLTRIAMALPHACVSCYYVCYVENPDNKLFDTTIKDSLDMVKSGHHAAVATSPLPRRFASD